MEELASEAACFSAAWDAIVNPQLFCSSATCGANNSSSLRNRTLSWSVCDNAPSSCPTTTDRQECQISECFPGSDKLFEVKGYAGGEEFSYLAKNVVLATGSYDRPNRIDLKGEDNTDFVVHSLGELESRISSGQISPSSDPVVVVGAGLSAADAIVTLKSNDIKTR